MKKIDISTVNMNKATWAAFWREYRLMMRHPRLGRRSYYEITSQLMLRHPYDFVKSTEGEDALNDPVLARADFYEEMMRAGFTLEEAIRRVIK